MICTIVATGNSLRGFDFSQLKGFVIGINFAYQHINCDIVVARDNLEKVVGEKIPNLETLKHHGGTWIPTGKEGVARGKNEVCTYNCTLTTALNIAIQLGYKDIYVLGADNKRGEFNHFYDVLPDDWIEHNRVDQFYLNISRFLKGFKEGIIDERITFVESSIDTFESMTLAEYLR